eukprot:TCONS_00057877-protein
MRRSVICHTNDVSDDSAIESDCNQPADRPSRYSIQSLLASDEPTLNLLEKRRRNFDSKDSGYEDDDDSQSQTSMLSNRESVGEQIQEQEQAVDSNITELLRQTQTLMTSLSSATSASSASARDHKNLLDSLSMHGNADGTRLMMPNNLITEEQLQNFSFFDPKSDEFKHRFESSVLSALKDPQIQYLLTLYNFIDEGLLRNTLLKFLNGSSLDGDTLNAAERYLRKEGQMTAGPSSAQLRDTEGAPQNELFNFLLQRKARQERTLSTRSSPDFHIVPTNSHTHDPNNNIIKEKLSNLQVRSSSNEMQCEYCQKTFTNQHSLSRHLRTHEGTRTHKCAKCSRSFYDQTSYLRHVRSHNGEKKHKCDQCSMAFNKRSALEVHFRTHTGERPFECKYCGKGFSISGNLHRHVLIHTGHRPYKCGKCPRAFNNPSHLARHINSFHT